MLTETPTVQAARGKEPSCPGHDIAHARHTLPISYLYSLPPRLIPKERLLTSLIDKTLIDKKLMAS